MTLAEIDWEGEEEQEGEEYLAGAGVDPDTLKPYQETELEEVPEPARRLVDIARRKFGHENVHVTVERRRDHVNISIDLILRRNIGLSMILRYNGNNITLLVENDKILEEPVDNVKIRLVKDDKYVTCIGYVMTKNGTLEMSIHARHIDICIKDSGKIILFDTCRPWD